MTEPRFRGSRRHVLDWAESPTFAPELTALVQPVDVIVDENAAWMPRSRQQPREARLETFGPRYLGDVCEWSEVANWWLKHKRGANTPNWDIACPATINGALGVALVEAKANISELSASGKPLAKSASLATRENHDHIGVAIQKAQAALAERVPGVNLSRDHHYQLSNRVAFAWKLASLGVPTVLLYLGFLRSPDFSAAHAYRSAHHWDDEFRRRTGGVWPATHGNNHVDLSEPGLADPKKRFWVLTRSIDVGARA